LAEKKLRQRPYRYDGKTLYDLRFPRHPMKPGSTPGVGPSDSVYSIYRDRSGSIWFGLAEWGLYRYDGKTLDWHYQRDLTETPTGGSIGIRAILQDRAGSFWISNNRNRFTFGSSRGKPGSVQPMQATKEAGMPSPPGGPSPIYALSMTQDREGNIWMVTYNKGVWRYDGRQVTRVPVNQGDREVHLYSIALDRSGGLWLGTHDGGAYRFDGKTFQPFSAGR
jgi:ligand-binding sensor domain-containing protein